MNTKNARVGLIIDGAHPTTLHDMHWIGAEGSPQRHEFYIERDCISEGFVIDINGARSTFYFNRHKTLMKGDTQTITYNGLTVDGAYRVPPSPITKEYKPVYEDPAPGDSFEPAPAKTKVTVDDIEAEIVSEHYFTAWEGAQLAYWNTSNPLRPKPARDQPDQNGPLSLLTFCVLVLKNGFTVTGESACVDPANFDAQMGRDIARKKAVDKCWPLLGFRLADSRT